MTNEDARQDDGPNLAFVLVREAVLPNAEQLGAAIAGLGLQLGEDPIEQKDDTLAVPLAEGTTLLVSQMPVPHPSAAEMPLGLTSPDEGAIAECKAHYIVALIGMDAEPLARDIFACRAVTAVVRTSSAIGAMFGWGRSFHDAELWERLDPDANEENPPIELLIDASIADEGQGRLSILTHGMPRYGRENLHVFAPHAKGQDAAEFCFQLAHLLVSDPEIQYPTGDTVGRSAREKHRVDRGPSPIDPEETVMILRM